MISAAAHTIARVKVARFMAQTPKGGTRAPLPRQQPAVLLEQEYGAALAELLTTAKVRAAFAPLLSELPSLMASAKRERGDSSRYDAGEGARVRALIKQATDRLSSSVNTSSIEALAQKFAARTSTYQRVQLNRQTRTALGVDIFAHDRGLQAKFNAFAAENVALIKDLPARIAAEVEKTVTRAVASAKLHPDIADDLENQFGFGERRSKLIARDQVGKLYGQLNASRQKDLGITKFVWRSVEDDRVRPEHEDLDGETFAYDDPPDEGLPGEPVLCRCSAEPVFDNLLDTLDEGGSDADATE